MTDEERVLPCQREIRTNSNEPPTKVKKAIHLLQMWEKERVAIGVRKIEVAESYYGALWQKKAYKHLPNRRYFIWKNQ